jgi:hypothetical protein
MDNSDFRVETAYKEWENLINGQTCRDNDSLDVKSFLKIFPCSFFSMILEPISSKQEVAK